MLARKGFNMKKFITGIFFVVAIILLVLVIKIISPYVLSKTEQEGLTEVGPKVSVLVIDSSKQSPEDLIQHVEQGKASLLLWIEENQGSKQAYTFNTLESLVRLEQNRLGFLDSTDPGLKNLNVARFSHHRRILYYTAAKKEGISAIEASRNYLIGEVLSDPQNYKNPAGKVIFKDGSKKVLYMVKLLESEIEDAKLLPAKQGHK